MNKHTPNYLKTHDLDVFFLYQGSGIHYASNGNLIPGQVNFIKTLNAARMEVAHFPNIISWNRLYINRLHIDELYAEQERVIEETCRENEVEPFRLDRDAFETFYLSSFVRMAMKGFYSFDCTRPVEEANEEEDNAAILTLIAGPDLNFDFNLLERQPLHHPEPPFADISELVTRINETHLSLRI